MDLTRLWEILQETTTQFRKGGTIEGTPQLVAAIKEGTGPEESNLPDGVVHIYDMPHISEATSGDIEAVDCHFIVVGVNKAKALERKAELIEILRNWPDEFQGFPIPRLGEELTYITVGAVVGSQGGAFLLFALGQVLGFWKVLTPEIVLGTTGQVADLLAGRGYITINEFKID